MAAAWNNIIGLQFYGGKRITGARHITFYVEVDNKFKYKFQVKHVWMLTVSNTATEEMSIYKKFKVYTESAVIKIIDRNWSMNSMRLLTDVKFWVFYCKEKTSQWQQM
jgi:hypothetical protein